MMRVMPSAGMLVLRSGEIAYANAAAREAIGLHGNSPRASLDAFVLDSPGYIADYLRMCARTTSPIPGAFRVQRESAAPIAYQCKGSLLTSRTETAPALILLRFEAKDVASPFLLLSQTVEELTNEIKRRRDAEAALRRSEEDLQARVVEAETANRLKDEFLAALSHELRTPLNSILGWTSLIREGVLTEERRDHAMEVIERNARIQADLIEELLDVSRIISGKLRLNVQQIAPILVVEAAIESLRPAAEAKRIRLQCVLDPQAGPISGDPDRLQQIVWNLISNAVKFTPKHGRIQILLERINSSIEISVNDTGQGIDPEFLPYLFERFRQQEATSTRRHGGLGLGLAIAKNLVELHGGTIRAHSDGAGLGASFIVRLPRTLAREDLAARPFASVTTTPSQGVATHPHLGGIRVLLVDDDADALEFVIMRLRQGGAEARTARSAREGLDLLASWRPDILVSDIGMPGEDGYDLIRSVRALPPEAGGKTVAIALTAFARMEDRVRVLAAGFQSHVPKPVDCGELFTVMGSLLGRYSGSHQL